MPSPSLKPAWFLIPLLLLPALGLSAADEWLANLKPAVNADLVDLPDDSCKLMRPKGDDFNHPKTEVGLVYDEKLGGVVYFAGCSSGYRNSVWLYHVGTNTWKEIVPWLKGKEVVTGKPIGQCGYYATYISDLNLYFKHRACSSTADGRDGSGRDSNTWTLDVGKRQWKKVASGPHYGGGKNWPGAYCCYALAYDRDARQVILYGGMEDERGTWAFDFKDNKWKKLKPKNSPPPLFLHSMVYDSVNKVTLLFGGQTGGYSAGKTSNETWAYHSRTNTWEKKNPKVAPPPRAQAQACFDSVNGVVIVHGGHAEVYPKRDQGRFYTDTWVYDYKSDAWTKKSPKQSPPGSAVRFMAFDPVNNIAINVTGHGAKKQTWVYRYRKAKGKTE
jgi:hypothetical protein